MGYYKIVFYDERGFNALETTPIGNSTEQEAADLARRITRAVPWLRGYAVYRYNEQAKLEPVEAKEKTAHFPSEEARS